MKHSVSPPQLRTANELLDNATALLMRGGELGEHQARYKAARAIVRLMSVGAYEWWGMSEEGEPLFESHVLFWITERKEQ